MTAYQALTQLESEAFEAWMNAKSGARMKFAEAEWKKLNTLVWKVIDDPEEYEEPVTVREDSLSPALYHNHGEWG